MNYQLISKDIQKNMQILKQTPSKSGLCNKLKLFQDLKSSLLNKFLFPAEGAKGTLIWFFCNIA